MTQSRTQLEAQLNALAAWVPTMLAETDEASQMDAFASRADLISKGAPPEYRAYAWSRLQRILVDNCMVPADESPCDD